MYWGFTIPQFQANITPLMVTRVQDQDQFYQIYHTIIPPIHHQFQQEESLILQEFIQSMHGFFGPNIQFRTIMLCVKPYGVIKPSIWVQMRKYLVDHIDLLDENFFQYARSVWNFDPYKLCDMDIALSIDQVLQKIPNTTDFRREESSTFQHAYTEGLQTLPNFQKKTIHLFRKRLKKQFPDSILFGVVPYFPEIMEIASYSFQRNPGGVSDGYLTELYLEIEFAIQDQLLAAGIPSPVIHRITKTNWHDMIPTVLYQPLTQESFESTIYIKLIEKIPEEEPYFKTILMIIYNTILRQCYDLAFETIEDTVLLYHDPLVRVTYDITLYQMVFRFLALPICEGGMYYGG